MSIPIVLLLCLFVGIVVGIMSRKLTLTELLICGTFGLLLGGTPVGRTANRFILDAGESAVRTMTQVLS